MGCLWLDLGRAMCAEGGSAGPDLRGPVSGRANMQSCEVRICGWGPRLNLETGLGSGLRAGLRLAVTAARLLRLLLRLLRLRLQLLLRVVCAWLGTEVGLTILAVAVGGLDLDRVRMALALKTRHSRGVGAGCGLTEVQAGLGRGQERMDRGRRAGCATSGCGGTDHL